MTSTTNLIERLEKAGEGSRELDADWWRLKPGLSGLKPFMPGRSIRWAKEKGFGWPRHYEPTCRGCSAIRALKLPASVG